MSLHLKTAKSLSMSKKQIQNKNKQRPLIQKVPDNRIKKVLQEYGEGQTYTVRVNKKFPLKKLSIVQSSTTCISSEEQNNFIAYTTFNQRKKPFVLTKEKIDLESSQSSISSISLNKKDSNSKQNTKKSEQKNNIYINRLQKKAYQTKIPTQAKNISTKTSIKQIQEGQTNKNTNFLSPNTPSKKPHQIKPQTLETVMKSLVLELKQVRKQNKQMKEQLIKIKSQQFYKINRQKVREMVTDLENEKKLRTTLQKQNNQLRQNNLKLVSENKKIKKEYLRVNRANAQMKDQLECVQGQNKRLRQRFVKMNTQVQQDPLN